MENINLENLEYVKEKTISGLFWRFAERGLAQSINVLVSIFLARLLLPEEYSVVALVSIFINLANTFVTNGLGTALIQKKDVDKLDYNTAFWGGIVLSLLLYLVLYITAPLLSSIYNKKILTPIIRVMGIRLPLAAINSIQHAYVSRSMQFKKFFFATLLGTVLSAIVGIGMAISGYGAWSLVGQYLVNVIVDTILLTSVVKLRINMEVSKERFHVLFSFSGKLMLTGFLGMFFDQLRSLLIGVRYTTADLSYCNQGERIPSFLANNINSTMESVLFPSISKLQDDNLLIKRAFSRVVRTSSFLISFFLIGLAAMSNVFIRVILSDEWIGCVPYMQLVCITMCVGTIGTVSLQVLKAMGRSDLLLKLELIKKPIYLLIIFIALQISPLAICVGNLVYNLIAIIINFAPTKKLLLYSYKEQWKDIGINYLEAIFVGVIVWVSSLYVTKNIMGLLVLLLIWCISGLGICYVFRNESLFYVFGSLKNYIKGTGK